MGVSRRNAIFALAIALSWSGIISSSAAADEPPALNPFQPNAASGDREDVLPGYLELSDGTVYFGRLYLTRDHRLKLNDDEMKRQREIPLRAVKQIDCKVLKEWMEKEYRFKELALNEKMYTGRQYPTRLYEHLVTLQDGRTITGGLSGVVYVLPGEFGPDSTGGLRPDPEPIHFMIHKRDKGNPGDTLKKLLYVKTIKLGDDAMKEGRAKASTRHRPAKAS